MQGRALLVALAALAPLAAGCLGPAAPGPASADPAAGVPAQAPALPERVAHAVVTATGDGLEPTVLVDGEGTIYVTAAQGIRATTPRERYASRLWVSHDGGATFPEVVPTDPSRGPSNLPFGAEGDLALDQAGAVYFIDLTLASTTVSRSTDGGRTWEVRTPAAFLAPVGDRAWVAAGPADTVAVTWDQLTGMVSPGLPEDDPSSMWVAVSRDGGRTFPTQSHLPEQGESASRPLVFTPDGTLYTTRVWGGMMQLYRSDDAGATFAVEPLFPVRGVPREADPVITADEDGTLYLAWVDLEAGNGENQVAYASRSLDRGATWSPPAQVSTHQGSTAFVWAAATRGELAVVYYGAPGAPGMAYRTDAAWYPMLSQVSFGGTGPADGGPGDAGPRVRALPLSDAPVLEGALCTRGTDCDLGPVRASRALGDYLVVDTGPDGHAHAVWGDAQRQVHWGKVRLAR